MRHERKQKQTAKPRSCERHALALETMTDLPTDHKMETERNSHKLDIAHLRQDESEEQPLSKALLDRLPSAGARSILDSPIVLHKTNDYHHMNENSFSHLDLPDFGGESLDDEQDHLFLREDLLVTVRPTKTH